MNNKTIHMVTFILLVVGGLNWLLIGLFEFNIVGMIGDNFGTAGAMFDKIVYILVGISAVYEVMKHKTHCKMCSADGGM
jgi:uncharacterized membrane protein YuzA (DUF378 family)